jgi:hypothetical protein
MIAFLLAACVGQTVDVPKEIKGAPGAWVIVAPKVDGGPPKWRIDPALQEVELGQLLPPEFTSKLKGRVFTSNAPGRYKIELWCAKANVASDIATTWIVIGNPPNPPGPGPDPGPQPPPPPAPTDPLGKALAAAYAADSGKDKLPALVSVFRDAEKAAREDMGLYEVKDLISYVSTKRAASVGEALPIVRGAIGEHLEATLPKVGFLNPQNRKTCEAEMSKVAKALESLR